MSAPNDITQDSGAPTSALLASQEPQTPFEYVGAALRRIRSGEIGALPIILGLVIIGIIFQSLNQNFLTPRNLVNITIQMAGYATIAYGMVFILLLGEIDLSVGYVSAVGGVMTAILLRDSLTNPALSWMDWWNVIPIALAITTAIGFLHGTLITTFQLPSFIVTLAGLLAWNGVVLMIVGDGGTVNIQNPVVRNLASEVLPPIWSWIVIFAFVALLTVMEFATASARRKAGLRPKPVQIILAQTVIMGVVGAFLAYLFNINRALGPTAPPQQGMPVIAVIMLVFLIVLTYLAERTRFGRYIYAVGGNKEAARRAGIRVERIRVLGFMVSGFMAGVGGIVLASRLKSVATDTGGGNLLLYVIAAAVIGGTSLFGGRGKVYSAILGALVVSSVENGMGLLNVSSGVKFVVTGLVLLAAVVIDAISRRSQQRSGLR
ncbi:MAG: sugar ABC transporter permease [Anaerolineae bacterium]|nr:sugar ABC transporter permease [Anaerolineae bacterium]NUQ06101.1 sugar ABC transporter permease [Anaerolineae bacterium]